MKLNHQLPAQFKQKPGHKTKLFILNSDYPESKIRISHTSQENTFSRLERYIVADTANVSVGLHSLCERTIPKFQPGTSIRKEALDVRKIGIDVHHSNIVRILHNRTSRKTPFPHELCTHGAKKGRTVGLTFPYTFVILKQWPHETRLWAHALGTCLFQSGSRLFKTTWAYVFELMMFHKNCSS